MRTPLHHPLSAVFLSAILGWIPSGRGPLPASNGPAWRPAAPRFSPCPAADVSDDGSSGQVKATTPVQAPPLQAPPLEPAPGNPVVVVISTSLGDITVELFKDRAPVSVENFLQYANDGFYAGTIFHRVKPGL